jgi:putative transposase
MTCETNGNTLQDVLQLLTQGEPDNRLAQALRLVLNTAMLLERQQFLGVEPYQRGQERQDQANGFKPKTLQTRLGALELAVPQTRSGGFYPASLEKGQRSERALKLALAEMYVQGVSTRRVAKITEELCGFEVSSAQVSRAAAELDSILEAWRARPLSLCPYLLLDARYESVRIDGVVRQVAVLVAVGVTAEGKRSILGVSISLSEQEVHWREFLQSLVARGLSGVELITSDNHIGLKAARKATFGGVPWQRCQFHLQQNAQSYVPKQEMKKQVACEIRAIFNAPDLMAAELLTKQMVARYEKSAPKLSAWVEQNLFEGLMVFRFPEAHRRLLRTTNGLERVNKEIRRRTRVANLFPNEASCLRLVSAVLMEISEEWETGKAYLTLSS